MGKIVKLGPKGASLFFDPAQSKEENQRLLLGQVKELDETPLVQQAMENRGLVEASDADMKAYQQKQEEVQKQQANQPSAEDIEAANAGVMQKAQELETREGNLTTKEAELKAREEDLAKREAALTQGGSSASTAGTDTGAGTQAPKETTASTAPKATGTGRGGASTPPQA